MNMTKDKNNHNYSLNLCFAHSYVQRILDYKDESAVPSSLACSSSRSESRNRTCSIFYYIRNSSAYYEFAKRISQSSVARFFIGSQNLQQIV